MTRLDTHRLPFLRTFLRSERRESRRLDFARAGGVLDYSKPSQGLSLTSLDNFIFRRVQRGRTRTTTERYRSATLFGKQYVRTIGGWEGERRNRRRRWTEGMEEKDEDRSTEVRTTGDAGTGK